MSVVDWAWLALTFHFSVCISFRLSISPSSRRPFLPRLSNYSIHFSKRGAQIRECISSDAEPDVPNPSGKSAVDQLGETDAQEPRMAVRTAGVSGGSFVGSEKLRSKFQLRVDGRTPGEHAIGGIDRRAGWSSGEAEREILRRRIGVAGAIGDPEDLSRNQSLIVRRTPSPSKA